MKKIILLKTIAVLLVAQPIIAQNCKTNTDVDTAPGKYLTAAQYPWPAVRAEYFNKLSTPADKAIAKQTLAQIETIEQQSHQNFKLTGANWENLYASTGYEYYNNTRLGKYYFQAGLYEYFCANGKLTRNSEATTILRIYANSIPVNTLDRFLSYTFGSSFGEYDLGFQYQDWKNHKSVHVDDQLISLFKYLGCTSASLISAINNGGNYFQDVAEKDIKPNNRNTFIYRYWFIKKNSEPVLLTVSRKEYLQSLLEYYEREKLYFPKLIAKLTADHDAGVKQYADWERDVADKIAIVKKTLANNSEEWLAKQAVINHIEDASLTYKAQLKERTNYNRFWKFHDGENKSEPLYQYNPAFFKNTSKGPAAPKFISVAFRYVSLPISLRQLNNFTQNFNFDAIGKLIN